MLIKLEGTYYNIIVNGGTREATREEAESIASEYHKVVNEFPKSKEFDRMLRTATERLGFGIVEISNVKESDEVFELMEIYEED